MSYTKEFRLPNLGDGDSGGRIVEWLVGTGQDFEKEEVLAEVETDKAVVEIQAAEAGRLLAIVADVDARVARNQVIARIEVDGNLPSEDAASISTGTEEQQEGYDPGDSGAPGSTRAAVPSTVAADIPGSTGRILATPAARRKIAQTGLSIRALIGTGRRGRINLSDVDRALSARSVRSQLGEQSRPVAGGREEDTVTETRLGPIGIRRWCPDGRAVRAPVVLFHGLFADAGVWSATARVLARRGSEVLAIDLPNHGRSACEATTFPDVVDAVSESLRHARIRGPMVLCGHSYGGAVAARLAGGDRGIPVKALLLIAPLGFGTEIHQSFLQGMLHAENLAALTREAGRLTASSDAAPAGENLQGLLDHIRSRHASLAAMCHDVARHGVQQVDLRQSLADCTAPARLIWGRRDEILPWQHALSAPAKAALHLVPDAGHMPMWEAGALTTDVLGELSGTSSQFRLPSSP